MCDICGDYTEIIIKCENCHIKICFNCNEEIILEDNPHILSPRILCMNCAIASSMILRR